MTHIEAMKQALSEMERANEIALREFGVGLIDLNAITALRTAIEQAEKQEPLTDSFVQQVPDKCDRIVWRGSYYHLPPAAQPKEPLTKEQVSVVRQQAGYDVGEAKEIAAFISGIRHCEAAHGIGKGEA